MKRKRVILSFLLLAVFAGGTWYAYKRLTAPPTASNDDVGTVPAPISPVGDGKEESAEEKERRKLLGIWQDDYQGKRTMTVNEDGTATMAVELKNPNAILFGPKLRFDMKWSLDGKKFIKKTTGGEPAEKVNVILNLM